MFRLSLFVSTICLAFSFSTSVLAATPSNAQLYEMVKALQSRVTVLEKQNTKYQRELMEVHKGAEPARLQLASLTPSADEPKPMRLANPTGDALQPQDNWSGMYFGASFGAGVTEGSHSMDVQAGNTNIPISGMAGTDTNSGAVTDLFIGLNSQIRPRLVGGVQLEGSLAALNFDSDGKYTFRTDAPISYDPEVEAQWMASALARVGWLIRPNTMLYGLAGWTFAHFDVGGGDFVNINQFDANGPSVGVGIERKLDSDWSIRAEYRFTDFGKTKESSSKNGLGGYVTAGENTFDNEMHIGRIGVARRLGRSEPSGAVLK
jgi:outer membrane immunogenic protein